MYRSQHSCGPQVSRLTPDRYTGVLHVVRDSAHQPVQRCGAQGYSGRGRGVLQPELSV